MGNRIRFLVLAAGCGALIAGCANNAAKYAEEPYYPAGYNDGCSSAKDAGRRQFTERMTRDEELFKNDAGYRYGWRQGFNACGAMDFRSEDAGYEMTDNPF